MGRYRKIDSRIWNDAKFCALSKDGKLVFLMLLTHPSMTALGAMRASLAGLGEELGWEPEAFREAFREAFLQGMVEHDPKALLIALPNFLKYNPPESPNVVKAWVGALDLLPECDLKIRVVLRAKGFAEAFGEAFGKAFAKAMPNPEQEPEQEPEPEHYHPSPSAQDEAPPPAKPSRSWKDLFRKNPDALPSFEAILEAQQAARKRIIGWNLPESATPEVKPSPDATAFLALVVMGYSPRLLRACHAEYLLTSGTVKSGFLQALTTFFGKPGGKGKATFEGLIPQAEALLARNDAALASQAPQPPEVAPDPALPTVDLGALAGSLPFS